MKEQGICAGITQKFQNVVEDGVCWACQEAETQQAKAEARAAEQAHDKDAEGEKEYVERNPRNMWKSERTNEVFVVG